MTRYLWKVAEIKDWLHAHGIDPATVGIVHYFRPSGAAAWWLICDRTRHPGRSVTLTAPYDLLHQEFASNDAATAERLNTRQRLFRTEDVNLISVADTFEQLAPDADRAVGVWEGDDAW